MASGKERVDEEVEAKKFDWSSAEVDRPAEA